MFFKQYYLECLAQASYVIGDEASGKAIVVDPRRDIEQYLDDAAANGLEITHTILTHFHADFIAGHIEMRDRVGARICIGAQGEADFDFQSLHDGDLLELGAVRIKFLETPGHTPESISVVVYDLEQSGDDPHAVLTGDTLFIGDVGRPDLLASIGVTAEELGSSLYDSLHDKLLKLPDTTLLYPGHGAGSMCGRALSNETVSTMGEQRRYNYALQPMAKDEFIRVVTADQPDAPDYFLYDAGLNRKERPTLDAALEAGAKPLSLDDVLRLRDEGAQLLDVREAGPFAAAHLRGSTNVGLGGQYASWAGTLLGREKPIVIIAEPGSEKEAALRLGRIGLDRLAGYLDGGMEALQARPAEVGHFVRLAPATLAEQRRADDALFLLDVRNEPELQDGKIEGSTHIPLNHLAERLDELPRDGRITVYCAGGYRSSIAASVLLRHGFADVADIAGGFAAWDATVAAAAGA